METFNKHTLNGYKEHLDSLQQSVDHTRFSDECVSKFFLLNCCILPIYKPTPWLKRENLKYLM